ncbi:MAG: hypothetical protein AAF490_04865 [Chloroflexota bacterium]
MAPSSEDRTQWHSVYDFHDPKLWFTRFFSIYDSITKTYRLVTDALASVESLSIEQVRQLISDSNKQDSPAFSDFFVNWSDLDSERWQVFQNGEEREGSYDLEFEVKQLLNLWSVTFSLDQFVNLTVYKIIDNFYSDRAQNNIVPPLHLMRTVFRLISDDVEILQQAISQRSWETDASGSYAMSQQTKALLVTDKLATMALLPFMHLLDGGSIIPITFFSRRTHIHHVPYSKNILLIGIGYDHITLKVNDAFDFLRRGGYARRHENYQGFENSEFDYIAPGSQPLPSFELLVIPHEVGHYIYKNARHDDTQTFAELAQEQFKGHPYFEWIEEIFADIYGCMIAGPLMALGLQSLLASGDEDAVCSSDGMHPPSIIRPFILSQILTTLSEINPEHYPFKDAAFHLNWNWSINLEPLGYSVDGDDPNSGHAKIHHPNWGEESIDVFEILQSVHPFIELFSSILMQNAHLHPSDAERPVERVPAIPWSHAPYEDLTLYDAEMADLTGQEIAQMRVPNFPLIDLGKCLIDDLETLCHSWRNDGPDSGSGSKGTLRYKTSKNTKPKLP